MKTIIFGGSFDPIHNGHIQIARKAQSILNADRVLFLVAKSPRWKKTMSSTNHRINMLKLALQNEKNMEISYLEVDSIEEVNYTYKTLLRYEKKDDEEVYFLFGYDQLEVLDKWYEIDKLKDLVHLVAFNRLGYSINMNNVTKYNVQLIDIGLSSMSSSALRELKNVDAPKEVLDYIVQNELYYIPKIKSYISGHRYEHTISVANTAYEIAKRNSINVSKAYIASLLHDIGKNVDINLQDEFVKKNYPSYYGLLPLALYHQFVSVDIAKNDFKIDDNEIIEAIKYHATGKANMTKLMKCVYASDKIEPTRDYDSSLLINQCKEDIDLGFNQVLEENVLFFKKKNIPFKNPLTISCIEYYLGKEILK